MTRQHPYNDLATVVSRDERGSVWFGFDPKPNRNQIYSVPKIKTKTKPNTFGAVLVF